MFEIKKLFGTNYHFGNGCIKYFLNSNTFTIVVTNKQTFGKLSLKEHCGKWLQRGEHRGM